MTAGDLHRLARLLREIAQLATADPGERAPAASTLAVVEDVAEHPRAAITDIAGRAGLAQSMVSRTVDQLQRRGVLLVTRDPADGRRSLVEIDPKIRTEQFAKRGARPVSAALRRRLPKLTTEQRHRVQAALDILASELLEGGKD